jgi:hypothetical protein
MNTEEHRIREFAYQIWEAEGRPQGQHERHWEMARKLASSQDQTVSRPVTRARKVTKPQPAPEMTPEAETRARTRAVRAKADSENAISAKARTASTSLGTSLESTPGVPGVAAPRRPRGGKPGAPTKPGT